jgi:hypothetical protein
LPRGAKSWRSARLGSIAASQRLETHPNPFSEAELMILTQAFSRRSIALLWLSVLAIAWGPAGALGQDPQASQGGTNQPLVQGQPDESNEPISLEEQLSVVISIEVANMTVDNFVQTVKDRAWEKGATINVIVEPDIAEFMLPRIELEGVAAKYALASLVPASNGAVSIDQDQGDGNSFLVVGGSPDTEPNQVLVVNVKDLLQSIDKPALVGAIEQGLQMMGGSGDRRLVQLQLHEGTGLLFSRGSPQELRLISDICEEIRKGSGKDGNK